jgi:NTF2-like N-terminal transpeptidase domain
LIIARNKGEIVKIIREEWMTNMRNHKYFVATIIAVTVVVISLIFIGVFLLGGNGNSVSKPQRITAKEIADQKKVIDEYYQAIDQGNYRNAYNLTDANFKNGMSYKNFVYQYKEFVKSVKIKSIARLMQYSDKDNGVFNVTLNATYKQKYPYYNGELPGVHVLQRDKKGSTVWRLDSIGVGQGG